MKNILWLLPAFIIVNYCNAQKFKPALNLVKGNTYYLTTDAKSAIVQTVSGQQDTANLAFSFKIAFNVAGVADSVYNMEARYVSFTMKMIQPGNIIDVDSKNNDPQDLPSTIFAALINKPFNLQITKTGRVRSVQNFDKMIAEVISSFPKADSIKKQQIEQQFIRSFGPDAIKGSIEAGTAIFPAAPVAKDESWTVNTFLENPAKATVAITYQLTAVVKDTYLIHGDGKIATDTKALPVQINGLPVKYDLIGSIFSDIRLNKITGWITEVKLKQVMMGRMQIIDNPLVPGGMNIPMTFNTDVATTGK